LVERATLENLQAEKLPVLDHALADLTDFIKLSFSGSVPLRGKVAHQVSALIAELAGKGAIPPMPDNPDIGKEGAVA
jgi:hypothetical protein